MMGRGKGNGGIGLTMKKWKSSPVEGVNPTVFKQEANMTKQNELNWIRIPCGMWIGTMRVPRPSRVRGAWNRVRKTIKRVLQF